MSEPQEHKKLQNQEPGELRNVSRLPATQYRTMGTAFTSRMHGNTGSTDNTQAQLNGGDTDGNGYFGLVIANEHSTLCQGSGLSPGNQHLNESLRSESTAYLSALRYLLHYHGYYQ
eukprot:scaffold39404_cov36-Attheya_sp.AAC.5